MENKDLQEARTNPDFLKYLEEREAEVIKTKDLAGLYEVLDNLLILDIDEERANKVYETLLNVAFTKIEDRLLDETKLSLLNNDIFYLRAFYEHAIENYSYENFNGAKELFYILSQISEDEAFVNSMQIHMLACENEIDMDTFYNTQVSLEQFEDDEKYGYFIINFQFDKEEYLADNQDIICSINKKLEHILL